MFLVSRTNTPEIVNVLILLTTTTLSRDLHTDVWLIKPDQLALSLQQICSISINMKSPESSTELLERGCQNSMWCTCP